MSLSPLLRSALPPAQRFYLPTVRFLTANCRYSFRVISGHRHRSSDLSHPAAHLHSNYVGDLVYRFGRRKSWRSYVEALCGLARNPVSQQSRLAALGWRQGRSRCRPGISWSFQASPSLPQAISIPDMGGGASCARVARTSQLRHGSYLAVRAYLCVGEPQKSTSPSEHLRLTGVRCRTHSLV